MTNSTVAAASVRADESSSVTAGADGVLCRYADPEEQAGIVRRAASGERQFPKLQPTAIHALLDQVEDRDRAIVARLVKHAPPDDIAGLLDISARSLELRRQNILKRLGPTCGVDDRRQDGRGHRRSGRYCGLSRDAPVR